MSDDPRARESQPGAGRVLPVLGTRRAFVCEAARALVVAAIGVGPLGSRASGGRAAPGHAASVDVRPLTADQQWLVAPWAGSDGAPVLIVRRSATAYRALSMQCTHMGCPINTPVNGIMTCPCHGSQFDLAGAVRHGPAQFPLGHYPTVYHAASGLLSVTLD